MKYIERIKKEEVMEALKKAYDILPAEEFWDVRGLTIEKDDICWKTKDGSCFYVYQVEPENFVYFALDKKVQNIKGLYEVMLDLVYFGVPYVYFNGRKGRYNIIKRNFLFVEDDKRYEVSDDWDHLKVYAAHPVNVIRLFNRIGEYK